LIPTSAELKSVSGELVDARVVDIKARKGVLFSHYTELEDFKTQLAESNSGGYTLGFIVLGLGVAGVWLTRKRRP
jgi:hypothetical protein